MLFKVCILIDAYYSKFLTNFHDGWLIAAHAMKPDIHFHVQIWTLSKLAKGVNLEFSSFNFANHIELYCSTVV